MSIVPGSNLSRGKKKTTFQLRTKTIPGLGGKENQIFHSPVCLLGRVGSQWQGQRPRRASWHSRGRQQGCSQALRTCPWLPAPCCVPAVATCDSSARSQAPLLLSTSTGRFRRLFCIQIFLQSSDNRSCLSTSAHWWASSTPLLQSVLQFGAHCIHLGALPHQQYSTGHFQLGLHHSMEPSFKPGFSFHSTFPSRSHSSCTVLFSLCTKKASPLSLLSSAALIYTPPLSIFSHAAVTAPCRSTAWNP